MSKTKVLSGVTQELSPRGETPCGTGRVNGPVLMTEIPQNLKVDAEVLNLFRGFLTALSEKGCFLKLKIPYEDCIAEEYKQQIRDIPNIQVERLAASRLVEGRLSPAGDHQASSTSAYHPSLVRSQEYLEQFEKNFKQFEDVAEFSKKAAQVILGLVKSAPGETECIEMAWEEVEDTNT